MPDKLDIILSKQKLIVYFFLIALTSAVFWQVNQFGFVNIDDNVYVTQNALVQSGMNVKSFSWALLTTDAEFWHPLTWLSLIFDYELYGLNAGGYHLTNLFLHILSTLLLFWLFNRMTGAIWKSAFVAALFAVHPLHVESVVWIAERKDVLSAFFFMLTLCFYVYYTEKPAVTRYLLVVFFFICALMSKTIVVTLPAIMILLDYWPLKRFETHKNKFDLILWQLKEKIPFFVLSTFFSFLTLGAQYNTTAKNFAFVSRLANAPVAFVTYLEKTFWPHSLAVFYPFPETLPLSQIWGSVLLIIIISAAVVVTARRLPYLFVGWFWYAVTLLPVIGIIQVGRQAMADRYTYLPLIGIGVGLAWGLPLLLKRKRILFSAGMALLVFWSLLAWRQCGYWKDSGSLFRHALQVTKNNYLAHNNLGMVLVDEDRIQEALDHYDKAISIMPDHFVIYCNKGVVYAKTGQYQQAIEEYNKAIRIMPDYFLTYNNRGGVYMRLELYQLAIEDFSKSVNLKPDYADTYVKRGAVYLSQGNKESGCFDARTACDLGNCTLWDVSRKQGDCR